MNELKTDGIVNDRQLLVLLGLNDAQAAMYLGRSRQALLNKLKARDSGQAPSNYFKPHDVLLLVIAARRLGKLSNPADVIKIRHYVEETRARDYGSSDSYRMLLDMLGGVEDDFDAALAAAAAVVIIVPNYVRLEEARPELAHRLANAAAKAAAQPRHPWIVLLASTEPQTVEATNAFGLSGERFLALPSPYADHYTPMVLIYSGSRGRIASRPFILTDTGQLVSAPYFEGAMQTTCVKQMLPKDVRDDLFPPPGGVRTR